MSRDGTMTSRCHNMSLEWWPLTQTWIDKKNLYSCSRHKTGVRCDFIGLFFMEYSCLHIKNILKTFQSISYPLIYAQEVVICFRHAWQHTSKPTLTAALSQLACFVVNR